MTVGMHLALVVEDDRGVQKVLRMMLEANGFRVVIADSCARGERDARSQRPDVSIVDLGLPDLDGIELIKSIRTWSPMPIIVLSARTAEAQRLGAFEAGADDYVLKPFSAPELLARVRASLRRHVRGEEPTGVLEFSDLAIDLSRRVVQLRGGGEVRLTPLEHRILETLARNRDRVVTHSLIARVHHHLAQEAGARSHAPEAHRDRAGCGLSARGRLPRRRCRRYSLQRLGQVRPQLARISP